MPFRPGDFWRICDRTGRKVLASDTVKEWTGAIVQRKSYDARHPQDFVRARPERPGVTDARPRPTDVFQLPSGGPFFLIVDGGSLGHCIEIEDGQIRVYRGQDATPASEL